MKSLKVPLVGQPNVGKSSLLNALVGPRVVVSNYPGTTVEMSRAEKRFDYTLMEFVDTPGIYSISDRSEEEKITEKVLFEQKVDKAVVIVDSNSLERGLYMTLQILEAGIPTVVALNFVEDAEKKGITINSEKLEKFLKVPVIPINPLTGRGIDNLLQSIKRSRGEEREFKVEYDDHIEEGIALLSKEVKAELPARFVALRVLEEDKHFYKFVEDKEVIEQVRETLTPYHPEAAKDIAVTRYGTASLIANNATSIVPTEERKGEEKIDHLLLHRIWGPVITGLSLLVIFGVLLYLGNVIEGVLMNLTARLLPSFRSESVFASILFQGIAGLTAGVSIALPYVFLFYLILGFLEDVGLLSRFVVNAHRVFKKLGLPGKAFIPLALGLGCSAPAIKATRVLSNKKEQFYTASLFAFVPCSSRIAIIMGIVGFYGNLWLALSVFATLLIAGLLWALGIKKVVHLKKTPLLLELPPYRQPLVKNIVAKGWIRMKDFVYVVMPLLLFGGAAYGLLSAAGFTDFLITPFLPITRWLNLPPAAIVPIAFGFLQKDLTGAMLLSALGKVSLTSLQLYTFGVVTTVQIPCVIAFGVLSKEFGFKKALGLTFGSLVFGLLLAGLMWRIFSIL